MAENQSSARVRGPLHDSELLRLVEGPPHPDLLPARGEKETAVRPGNVQNKRQSHNSRVSSKKAPADLIRSGFRPTVRKKATNWGWRRVP